MSFLQKLDRMTQPFGGYCGGGGGGGSSVTTAEIDPDIKKALLPGIHQASADFQAGQYGKLAGSKGVEDQLARAGAASNELEALYRGQSDVGADISELKSGANQYGEGRDQTRGLAQDAIAGTGIYDNQAAVNRQLQNLQGNLIGQASAGGNLTSARGDRARQAALADASLGFQQQRQANAQQGAQALLGLGNQAQQAALTGAQLQEQSARGLGDAARAGVETAQALRGVQQQTEDAPYLAAQKYFGLLSQAPGDRKTTTDQGGGK